MANDLLEKLAELPVPPAPQSGEFDRALHDRINNRLLAAQVVDLITRGFGFAVWHFMMAVVGMARLTITGAWGAGGDRRRK